MSATIGEASAYCLIECPWERPCLHSGAEIAGGS